MTKADKARFLAFQKIGCVACRKRGVSNPADVHHLLSGGRRKGHQHTIPLCPWHHRGVDVDRWMAGDLEQLLGPSLAHGSKAFHAEFGSDQELLDQTELLLGMLT